MGKYKLKCMHPGCGNVYDTDDFRLKCDSEKDGTHGPAMLRAIYDKKKIEIKKDLPGIFKFIDWLPCGDNYLDIEGLPVAYKSSGLANYLGLSNLWVVYSGYWPEKGAKMVTKSFKQLEAPATLVRYFHTKSDPMPLIVSSAGNTANAFNYVTNKLRVPLYMVIPKSGLKNLKLPVETSPKLIVVRGDYADAISIADKIADEKGLFREGGARNIARRDGMGVAMLEAVTTSGHLFDHYFQAVGSGTGGIAAWEAVLRLIEDGSYGNTKTKLNLIQNCPFTPLVDSWNDGSDSLVEIEEKDAKERISNVTASVLTNRHPPYSIFGGVRDALADTNGNMYKINNQDTYHASILFRSLEGVDIAPAAAVATAALINAVNLGKVNKDEKILLHITGGGAEAQLVEFGDKINELDPGLEVNPDEIDKVLDFVGDVTSIEECKEVLKELK